MVGREMVTIDQGNRILNSLDWQGLGDGTSRTSKTSRAGKTRQTAWIDLTKNPIGPIPTFHP